MWTYIHTDELYHHGIKGQKWGVRRFQKKDGTRTAAGKKRAADAKPPHEDYLRAHDNKSVKYMSDQELRDRNNRLNAEKQYAAMTAKKSKGKTVVSAVIASGVTITGLMSAYGAYKKLGSSVVNSKVGKKASNAAFNKVADFLIKDGSIIIDKVH